MTPKDQALKLAQQIKDMNASDDDRYAIAVILVSTGLGVAGALIKSGKIVPMRALTLLNEVEDWVKRIRNAITPH